MNNLFINNSPRYLGELFMKRLKSLYSIVYNKKDV